MARRQGAAPARSTPPRRVGSPVTDSCPLPTGLLRWSIQGFEGRRGGCFDVHLEFRPGRIVPFHLGGRALSPAVGARFVPDDRPIAFVQTVQESEPTTLPDGRSGTAFDQPFLDANPNETDPFYGAMWNQADRMWADEVTAVADCERRGGQPGSHFYRPGRDSAVINDSPHVRTGQRKSFQTTAVVMATGEVLASLLWAVEHDGSTVRVHPVTCRRTAAPGDGRHTPDHRTLLDDFYKRGNRRVIDGFASGSAALPPGAGRVLDATATALGDHASDHIVVGGSATAAEGGSDRLARARADVVAAALRERGVTASRLRVESYAATWARAPTADPSSGPSNRRVQLTIVRGRRP